MIQIWFIRMKEKEWLNAAPGLEELLAVVNKVYVEKSGTGYT